MSETPGQPSTPGQQLEGRTIAGKYAIETIIGFGAMGAVYRARQIALDKLVAIKVMHRVLASDPTFARRFHREAKAASRLDHPNSIRILDFGEEPDGLLYLAMDLLDGRDLLSVIHEDWPLSAARIVDILSQTLSALAVANDLGILHRDLKPENIMVLRSVSDEGTALDVVKVCDFGIAKIIDAADPEDDEPRSSRGMRSTGGMVIGTPAYMSPEQARCEQLDARSDLYSVGVILYQMLTMCVPFDAPAAVTILLKHVSEEPRPPSAISSGVDARLESICLKAMSKRPSERYQSAREMRGALRALLTDNRVSLGAMGPISARPAFALKRSASATSTTVTLPALPDVDGTKPVEMIRAPGRSRRWAAAAVLVLAGAGILIARSGQKTAPEPSLPSAMTNSISRGEVIEPIRSVAILPTSSVPIVPPHPTTPSPVSVASPAARRAKQALSATRGSEPAPEIDVAPPVSAPTSNLLPTAPPAAPAPELPSSPAAFAVPATPARPTEGANESLAPATPAANPVVPPSSSDMAHVDIGSAGNTVGTTSSNVNRTIAPVGARMTACYRKGFSEIDGPREGTGTLHVETNEDGVITEARLDGRLASATGRCIAAAVRGRKIANVDTGSASADIPLAFKLR